jgi:AcrR family transcriptional regulator
VSAEQASAAHVSAGQASPGQSAKQRRRKRISDAATTLFFQHGFDAVSIAEIAPHAGVSKMTVTNHFALKEDLVFDEFDDELRMLGDALAGIGSVAEAIDAVERYCVARERSGGAARSLATQEFPDAWPAFAGMVTSSRALSQRFHGHFIDVRDVIARALPGTIPPRDAAIAAWMLAQTVHLLDWWPFEAATQGVSVARIRSERSRVRARSFELVRTGLACVS